MSLTEMITTMAKDARQAARVLASLSTDRKNQALKAMAEAIVQKKPEIQAENQKDVAAAKQSGQTDAFIDRLTLSDKVVESMVEGLEDVIKLPDPVGEVGKMWKRPNGLLIGRVRIPLGVIGFIYESRPNVTIDAASLCLKTGNAIILKGGKEAINSNLALSKVITDALESAGLPKSAVQVVPTTERQATNVLVEQEELVDLIIPRGGEGLIRFVVEASRIPVLKHYKGVCHVYVDQGADLDMAEKVCFNAKVQRPGVCNAMETMLVHKDVAAEFMPAMLARFDQAGVEVRGCPRTLDLFNKAVAAIEEDWPTEYEDLIVSVKVVDSMDEALDHIAAYSSNHTEAIVTRDYDRARRFLNEADSSTVLVNASTRFNDGGELGLGAEIGISTSKLHAFGPMGLEELTTRKFIVFGDGQVRT